MRKVVPEEGVETNSSACKTGSVAIGCAHPRPVTASHDGLERAGSPDEALRRAIVASLYAGDLARVRALVEVLEVSPKAKTATVLEIVTRRS